MQHSKFLKRDVKTFVVVNFGTAYIMILSSIIGHYFTPYKLIPSSVVGGTIGLSVGVYLSSKFNYIDKKNIFQVFLVSLFYFGLMAFVAVFNLHTPALIIGGFSITGLTTIISNRFFVKHPHISTSKLYGILGLMFAFPAIYFIVASILKFQLGLTHLFDFFDSLLNRTNGQENFNAITPFIFGGGLLLAFGLNLFSQIEKIGTKSSFSYKSFRLKLTTLNLVVVLLTGFVGLAVLSYLAVENL